MHARDRGGSRRQAPSDRQALGGGQAIDRQHSERRQAGARPGTDRGRGAADGSMAPHLTLTGIGAILVMVVAATLGTVTDLLLGPGLGTATMIMLAVGATVAAWLVRRRNLFSVVIAPPLVYLLLTVVTTLLTSDLGVLLTGLAAPLVYGFPAMAIATALTILVASIRQVAHR